MRSGAVTRPSLPLACRPPAGDRPRLVPVGLDDGQEPTGLHLVALGHAHLDHGAGRAGVDGVLHLHGLEDHQHLAGLDPVAGRPPPPGPRCRAWGRAPIPRRPGRPPPGGGPPPPVGTSRRARRRRSPPRPAGRVATGHPVVGERRPHRAPRRRRPGRPPRRRRPPRPPIAHVGPSDRPPPRCGRRGRR